MEPEVEFYPMTDIPEKEQSVDNFSKTVIVYELDVNTKEMYDVALGYYNFNVKAWFLNGGEPMIAYCWTYMPVPRHMKKSYFKPINLG